MKPLIKTMILIATMVSLLACASAPTSESMSAPAADMAMEESGGSTENFVAQEVGESNLDIASGSESTALLDRKIIRNAQLSIEVEDVIGTLNAATALSTRFGGYTASTSTWEQSDQPFAQISFAVPVERFEAAMEQTRALGEVKNESINSQDVTGQFVDVEARIKNLEATAERIRSFLDDAKKVEEALNVNRELSQIEGQLEVLKGQRSALTQQTSFSTINLEIRSVPSIRISDNSWSPATTFYVALDALLEIARLAVDFIIWAVMIGLPVLLFFFLLFVAVRWLFRQVRRLM